MPSNRPRIGVPVDCRVVGSDPSQLVGEKYLAAVAHAAGGMPLILPSRAPGTELADLREIISVDDQIDELDGLFLTGNVSNMEPWRYGHDTPQVGAVDAQRDDNNLALIRAAVARDLPVLAVCRGFQELNVAFGGSLHTAVHDVEGLADHRDDHDGERDQRYGPSHPLRIVPHSLLSRLAGSHDIQVNSLHGQGIDRLGEPLIAEAHAPDGLVEAIRHREATFAYGVQWHPEWRYADNPLSQALFAAFGDAARAYRAQRLGHGDNESGPTTN